MATSSTKVVVCMGVVCVSLVVEGGCEEWCELCDVGFIWGNGIVVASVENAGGTCKSRWNTCSLMGKGLANGGGDEGEVVGEDLFKGEGF